MFNLQAPINKGGLNLPDLKLYYLTSQLRAVWYWSHEKTQTASWLDIERHRVKYIPLESLPYIGTQVGKITSNLIISHTYECWQKCHNLIGIKNMLFVRTPLWNNFPQQEFMSDRISNIWQDSGIQVLGYLCKDGLVSEFSDIRNHYHLPSSHLFKYLQIRNWAKNLCDDYPRTGDTPLGKIINISDSLTGLISKLYKCINNCLDREHLKYKYKWEKDLNANYRDSDFFNQHKAQTHPIQHPASHFLYSS